MHRGLLEGKFGKGEKNSYLWRSESPSNSSPISFRASATSWMCSTGGPAQKIASVNNRNSPKIPDKHVTETAILPMERTSSTCRGAWLHQCLGSGCVRDPICLHSVVNEAGEKESALVPHVVSRQCLTFSVPRQCFNTKSQVFWQRKRYWIHLNKSHRSSVPFTAQSRAKVTEHVSTSLTQRVISSLILPSSFSHFSSFVFFLSVNSCELIKQKKLRNGGVSIWSIY